MFIRRLTFCFLLLDSLVLFPIRAQESPAPAVTFPDSLQEATGDTLRVRFIPAIGSIQGRADSSSVVHSSQFVRTDVKYLGELVWKIPGFFFDDLGEFGKYSRPHAFGNGIAVLLDGRPLNDPLTGTVNLYDIPIEAIEEVEPTTGSASVPLSAYGNTTVLNLVTRQYNNTRPITKLRYVQGPFEYGLTDGLFVQNIARGTNLMLGFQRHVTDGRFINSAYDSWHIRGRLRYNHSDRLNITLTEFYSSATNGLNGGVDPAQSPSVFDEVTAVVRSSDASEKTSRHDLTLLAVGKFLDDSSATTRLNAYFSEVVREYEDPDDFRIASGISEHHLSSVLGVRITQDFRSHLYDALIGIQLDRLRVLGSPAVGSNTESRGALFAQVALHISDLILPTASLRHEYVAGSSALSLGLRAAINALPCLSVYGDVSSIPRYPTFRERYWNDSTLVRSTLPSTERHDNIELGFQLKSGENASLSLSGFHRTITDAMVFVPRRNSPVTTELSIVPQVTVRGFSGRISLQLWSFDLFSTVLFTDQQYGGTTKSLLPRWNTSGELAYRNLLFGGAMNLRVGGRWRFASGHRGMQFLPRPSLFVENAGGSLPEFSTIDLFLVAQLGDAYLSLSWENILHTNAMLVQDYPMPGRGIRLGVNWRFID